MSRKKASYDTSFTCIKAKRLSKRLWLLAIKQFFFSSGKEPQYSDPLLDKLNQIDRT